MLASRNHHENRQNINYLRLLLSKVIKILLQYFKLTFSVKKIIENRRIEEEGRVDRSFHFLKSVGVFVASVHRLPNRIRLATRNITQGERTIHRSSFHILFFLLFFRYFLFSFMHKYRVPHSEIWKTRNAFNFARSCRVKERVGTS